MIKNLNKRELLRVLSLLAGGIMLLPLSSCKEKDNEPLPATGVEMTYTGNNLELYYNGELMPGKTAVAKVSNGEIHLKFSQSFDLSQLTGLGLTGSVAGPGVTPGDASLELEAPVESKDGKYLFGGSGNTDYVTFSYTGSMESDKLIFNITDSKLKNNIFAGKVFSPSPIVKEGLADYTSLPFHLVWEIDPALGMDLPLSEILKVIVTAPVIPVYDNTAYMSVAEGFESIVKTVALTDSGNIPVMYVSTLGGAAHIATTSGNMIQYVASGNGVKLYLNPLSVAAEGMLITSDNKNDEKFDFEKLLKKTHSRAESGSISDNTDDSSAGTDSKLMQAMAKVLLKAFAPSLSEGIPMTVGLTDKGADLYFDTATSVTFLATMLQDVMQNPEIMAAIRQALGSTQLPGMSQEEMAGLLQKLPAFLISTTKLEIGLSFENYQEK